MEIMVGYGIGPQTERILQYFWDHLYMVARAGSYCGTLFKGQRGITQGNPLHPTIFNLVVDTVISHWANLVEGE